MRANRKIRCQTDYVEKEGKWKRKRISVIAHALQYESFVNEFRHKCQRVNLIGTGVVFADVVIAFLSSPNILKSIDLDDVSQLDDSLSWIFNPSIWKANIFLYGFLCVELYNVLIWNWLISIDQLFLCSVSVCVCASEYFSNIILWYVHGFSIVFMVLGTKND